MRERIIEILFFVSLCSFCIEGSIIITLVGVFVFYICGGYVAAHPEDFLRDKYCLKVSAKKRRAKSRTRKQKYRPAV